MSYQTSTSERPKDLHLTQEETQREVGMYLMARVRQTGESAAEITKRMGGANGGPNLLEFLASVRVTREKYASRYEFNPKETSATDSTDRLRAMPDPVRHTIASNSVVEGDAVHNMREWQGLSGDRSRGLLLIGGAGAGKTLHASLLLRGSTLDIEREGYFVGESVLSMHLNSGTKSDKQASLAPMQATPLLVVDYMGQRKPHTGWEAGIVEFLRMRWESGKQCVLTFRGDLDAFKMCYGSDGWATVERFCTVVTVRRGS